MKSLYNFIIARWFMPSRSVISSLSRKYHMGSYLTEFKVDEDSPLIGHTYPEHNISEKYDLQVYKIIRKSNHNFDFIDLGAKQGKMRKFAGDNFGGKNGLHIEIEERYSKKKVKDTINFVCSFGYNSYVLKDNKLVNTNSIINLNDHNNFIFKGIE